jgi:ribosomal protein RSM22 (predicted rRNA methylase)
MNLWKRTKDILVLIDRGSPIGSQLILNARKQVIENMKSEGIEGHIVAPCPHEQTCPMENNRHKHWCHFGQAFQQPLLMVRYFYNIA